jgi:hypothetical protein
MNRLAKLTFTESKLFLRDPMAVFFAVAFPPLLLAILGAIPAFREPNEDLGGARVIDLYVPIMVGFVLAMLAISVIPTYLATYRERGILRRLSTTPMQPASLLPAELVMALVAVTLVLAVQLEATERAGRRPEQWRRHLDQARALARESLAEARRRCRRCGPSRWMRPACPTPSPTWPDAGRRRPRWSSASPPPASRGRCSPNSR